MDKHCFPFYIALVCSLLSCSTLDTNETDKLNDIRNVEVAMAGFESEDETKATVSIVDNKRYTAWDNTDEVGIFPDLGGYQLGFSLNGQGGQTTSVFDGGGWAMRADAKYAAYYPFLFENKDRTVISVDYAGQIQIGDSNTGHLGSYTFCASDPTASENGSISFLLNQVGTLVWFKLTLPDPATYTEITLATDDDLFVISGSYSLEENSGLVITPSKMSKTVTLKLNNVTTTASNQLVNAYMMVAPTDITGHSYKVYVKTSGGIYYSADLASKNHVFGKGAFKAITASPELSDGYNMGIGDWGEGGSISGGAN